MFAAKNIQLLSKTRKSQMISSLPLRQFAVEMSSGGTNIEVTSDLGGPAV